MKTFNLTELEQAELLCDVASSALDLGDGKYEAQVDFNEDRSVTVTFTEIGELN